MIEQRETCYNCYRPKSSCMCQYIHKISTNTEFIILMHPKEYRKTKNGTGHLTHISLPNSKIVVGINFSQNDFINQRIKDTTKNCFVLYPHEDAIELNRHSIQKENKTNVIFIIDSTWACSKKIIRESLNLRNLPKISFTHTHNSNFHIKTQPANYALSTIESTLLVLKHLHHHKIESISPQAFKKFLMPFKKMVDYQLNCALETSGKKVRYKNREDL